MEIPGKPILTSARSWIIFRDLGATPPWLYFAVFSCFAAGSFLRDSAFFWLPLLLGFMTALLSRMNVSDLLILALPFHFVLEFPFSATLSLAHLVVPFALLELLLQRPNGVGKLASNRHIGLLALWLGLLALSSAVAGFTEEIDLPALFVSFSKLTISVLFAVWAILRLSHQPALFLLLKLWVGVAVGVAVIGISSNFVASAFDFQSSFFYAETRLMATFENPNHFACHMLVSALL